MARIHLAGSAIRMLAVAACVCLVASACANTASSDASATDHFKGRTIRLVVAYAAGDVQDREARTIAKYLPKYIPGNPKIEVQDNPGASGLGAVQFVHAQRADGYTMLFAGASVPVGQLLGPYQKSGGASLGFDVSTMQWIGGTGPVAEAVWTDAKHGPKSVAELTSAAGELKGGASRLGSDTYNFIALLRYLTKANVKIITGYESGSDIALALLRNEIQIESGTYSTLLKNHAAGTGQTLTPLVILGKDVSEADQTAALGASAPNISTLAKTPEDQEIVKLTLADVSWGRLLAVPPKTPDTYVKALRDAFTQAANDPGYKADIKKAQLDETPISGDEVQRLIKDYLSTPPDTVKRYVAAMGLG